MKQLNTKKTTMKTMFNRYHHYLLTGICLLFLAASMMLTGCDINDSNDDSEPARPSLESTEIGPVEVFIENDNEETPTNSGAELYENRKHNPILAPDGTHLTLEQFRQPSGTISVKCVESGTEVTLELSGLIHNGVYTMWSVVFEAPGFDPTFEHLTGFGALGPADGTENSFLASVDGKGQISTVIPAGELSQGGEIGDCTLENEFEWHAVGAYHIDSRTYGPSLGPEGTAVE